MLKEHEIERAVCEGEVERVADLERRSVLHAAARGQILRRVDERLAEIDAGDVAAEGRGEEPGRPADAAAEVEHARLRPDGRHRGQVLGREQPARVELVHRGEVGDGQPLVLGGDRPAAPREFGR